MSVFTRLIASLHAAVFDTAPVSSLAFRLSRANTALVWAVADEVLTITVDGQGGQGYSYPLTSFTMATLTTQLTQDGFTLSAVNPALATRSASILLEMAGRTDVAYGDQIMAADNDLLRALFGGYARELRTAALAVKEAIKQMVIPTSGGEWLSIWGKLYGIKRGATQTDAQFAAFLPQEVTRARVNNYAIQQAVQAETGQTIYIREPWRDMFRLDSTATLSSQNRFYDGATIGPHLIQPIAYGSVDWTDIPTIINRNRAAGVIMMSPEEQFRRGVNQPSVGPIAMAEWFCYSFITKADDFGSLDSWLYLSDYSITKNNKSLITSVFYREMAAGENASYTDATPSHIDGHYAAANLALTVAGIRDSFADCGLVQAYPTAGPDWNELQSWAGDKTWSGVYAPRVGSSQTIMSSTWESQTTWPSIAWSAT